MNDDGDSRIYFTLEEFAPQPAAPGWLDGRVKHLSASSLSMWRRCPRQWMQRYLLHRKEPPGEGLVIGSFFHETLNFNYGQKIVSHEDRPLSELVEYLEDAAIPKVMDESGGEGEVSWDNGSGLETARNDSRRIVGAYHHAVLPRMQPVAVEQRMEWHMGAPVPVIGYLDTILADRVVDTKTGKQSVSKLKPGWRLQADLYSSYLGKPIEYQSISRAKTPKITTGLESEDLVVTPSHGEAANLVKVLLQICTQIEWMYERYGLEDIWPTWGRWSDWSQSISPCNYCGYRRDCPAWR
jgi:hypothetical protein